MCLNNKEDNIEMLPSIMECGLRDFIDLPLPSLSSSDASVTTISTPNSTSLTSSAFLDEKKHMMNVETPFPKQKPMMSSLHLSLNSPFKQPPHYDRRDVTETEMKYFKNQDMNRLAYSPAEISTFLPFSQNSFSFSHPNHSASFQSSSQRTNDISSNEKNDHYLPISPIRRKKQKGKIPRPLNAFMIYRQKHHKEILQELQSQHSDQQIISNLDVSRLIGQKWKNESDEVKKQYYEEAEVLKKEHQRLYPEYKFCPRKGMNNSWCYSQSGSSNGGI